ncbi:MAG: sulfatase-like hydrolase/transferase [Defluviitaleaceae bacterium]|nr:sulfatase-like hydrolase/transferase [Defluviitaleaceae bacterium]
MLKRIPDLRHNLAFNCILLALLGVITGLLSLLLGASTFGLPMFETYFHSPMVILLNLLPPVVLIFLMYFVSGRAWVAFSFPSLVVLGLSAVQFFKVQMRGDVFVASDIPLMREAFYVVGAEFHLTLHWELVLTIAAYICGVVFCVFVLKREISRVSARVAGSAVLVTVVVLLYSFVYSDAGLYDRTEGGYPASPWSFSQRYISRGFVYPFIHSIRYAFPAAPAGFDRDEARRMLAEFECGVIPDDKKINVITVMLESYMDLSAFGTLEFLVDVYGPLHRLQAESVSGMLINNVTVGKTIDTERLFLTGYTRLTRFGPAVIDYWRYLGAEHYSSAVNSYVHYLNSQGFHTEGYTAAAGWFYDRAAVNRHLGFAEYFFLEDFENSDQTDEFFFDTVMALYQARDRGTPYFSFNLSAQNHGPYDSADTTEPHKIARGDLSFEAFNILNNYLTGIYDTTWRLESFINQLRYDPDPVVVLVAGDHTPWMGNDGFVYAELGINVDETTPEGFLNLYSTPYFIWANYAARAVIGNDTSGYGGSFSPSFLMGKLFGVIGWDGEAYMQALAELKTQVSVISAPTGMFREHGVLTPALSPEAQASYNRLRMMEFYRLHNFAH